MTENNLTTIRVRFETKSELDKMKGNKESYNDVIIKLLKENEKLNKILCNVEYLQEHIQGKNKNE